MPQGKGTYGSKVGRPKSKKKKIDPVKKKKAPKKSAGAAKNTSATRAASKKKSSGTQTGYGPQNRPGTFAKKRVVRGSDKKKSMAPTGNQGMKSKRKKKPVNTPSAPAGYSKRTRMDMAAKEALSGGVAKKKKPKAKPRPSAMQLERMVNAANKKVVAGGGKRMSVSQLRKAGKINF
jgi:hypothetical protein